MASKNVRLEITNGPSLLDLDLAVIDRKHPRLLQFVVVHEAFGGSVNVTVTGIEQDSADDDLWIVCGWFSITIRKHTYDRHTIKFQACYNTRSREGRAVVDTMAMMEWFGSCSIVPLLK